MGYAILRLPEVIAKTALSRSTIYTKINSGTFPKPISLGERAIGFVDAEVDDWIKARIDSSRNNLSEG